MGKAIVVTYVIIFFASIFIIIITRLFFMVRLYSIKNSKVFGKAVEGEIIAFLMSMTLPFKIEEDPNDSEMYKIVRTLNRLKTVYWWIMLTMLIFIITMNVLEHGYDIKVIE